MNMCLRFALKCIALYCTSFMIYILYNYMKKHLLIGNLRADEYITELSLRKG